jgi:hypothetical protein
MRTFWLALAVCTMLVLPQAGIFIGAVHLPGVAVAQADSLSGDTHSTEGTGNPGHIGEKGNGGTGDCHCDSSNGNDKALDSGPH